MTGAKRWFITGVSSGIGEALAEAALARGDSVVGCARSSDDVARFAAKAPGRSIGMQLDVTRPDDVKRVVAAAIAAGSLDIVVNNAGQSRFGAFEETSIEEAKGLFDINVFGPWAVAQAVLPHLRQRGGGQLIHISSALGLFGMAGLSAYSASKFALEGFSEALAQEVAAFGIKLLLVEPGAVATKFISHGTREVSRRMPEYAFVSGNGKSTLEGYYASYASSPQQVADAILSTIASAEPPLRLIVGVDAQGSVQAKVSQLESALR